MPVTPAHRRSRQEDQKLRAILGYTANLRIAWETGGSVSINKQTSKHFCLIDKASEKRFSVGLSNIFSSPLHDLSLAKA